MSFFVFVRSNVARGASSLDLIIVIVIAVRSLDRLNIDIGIRPADRSSSTTFLHVARPACRPSTSINLGRRLGRVVAVVVVVVVVVHGPFLDGFATHFIAPLGASFSVYPCLAPSSSLVALALALARSLRLSFPRFLSFWIAVCRLPPPHAYLPLHLSAVSLHTLSTLRQPYSHDHVHPYNFPYPHLPRAFSTFRTRFLYLFRDSTEQRNASHTMKRAALPSSPF